MQEKKINNSLDSIKSELNNSQLECKRLNEQLTLIVTQQLQKGKLIEELKSELKKLENTNDINKIKKVIGRLLRKIDFEETMEGNIDSFSFHFDKANQEFLHRITLQYPDLTYKDHKLCVYLRLNMSSKDIAPLLNISVRGVEISRYRLRKKLNLHKQQNLVEFLGRF
ncbi:MAG: LuxR C-terminal-related transcriptional regulator [Saprospiraceae bacterium]